MMTFTFYQLAGLAGIVLSLVFSMVCFGFVQRSLWRVIEQDREIIAAQASQIALLSVRSGAKFVPNYSARDLETLFNRTAGTN